MPLHRPGTSRRSALVVGPVTAGLTALAAACGDAPSAPLAPRAAPQQAVLNSPATAKVLTRATPLSRAATASAVIGKAGGTLALPGSGLTLTVPAGAVSAPTTFTVSAPAGAGVWYEFGPSGAKFAVPLVIRQDLRAANMSGVAASAFEGAHFDKATRDESTKTAKVNEVVPVSFSASGTELTFKVTHFSGWMVSTGILGINVGL